MSDLQLDWFVTTDWFKDGGRVVVGPFSTQDGAFHARYVELFARAPRLGWDSWGLGYESASA